MNENSELVFTDVSVEGYTGENGTGFRLKDVRLTLRPGEWLNIAGTNGSGKSTLARLIAGLAAEGTTGTIARGFAGSEPAPYVMQQPDAQLFGESPKEEVGFALEWLGFAEKEIDARTGQVLERLGLLPLAGFGWDRLSGGQRQLAAVAAAAAGRRQLIVFDEATSMLDDESRRRVGLLAQELHASGCAVVWVTQQLDELDPEERVIALLDGKIVYDGTGREFLLGGEPYGGPAPCERCGLRPPYLASLALALYRAGKIKPPLPATADEWRMKAGSAW
ncbi:energy-coupling factor ABC transporter ATP-binding protein [Paenibacillus humicola]|uniref:energy-coupling factor ABC transporter ATP-binding protein n=1 Tax=Paenibacillus humicola TaxID=3110540 RepID=UPI00237A6758|nr:ABC transporter ATP-binding protein [Paenibacillus humicola]